MKNLSRQGFLVAVLMSGGGCGASMSGAELTHSPDVLARRIERAHGLRAWHSVEVLACDIVIYLDPQKLLEGTLYYSPHDNLARIEQTDGTLLVFDGERAWVSPASAQVPMARFHLQAWPYFLALPYKLRDPGTHRAALPPAEFEGRRHFRFKLTFAPGVGDTPEDWYIVYADAETDRLAAIAYIVTYGTPLEQAEQEPHAIVYRDEVRVDGALLSTRWIFQHWSDAQGPHGDPIGRAELANLEFMPFDPALFAQPEDAREDMLP